MGNQAGNCRQNSRPVYPKVFQYHIKTAAGSTMAYVTIISGTESRFKTNPNFFDVVNFLEFHRIGFESSP